MAARRSFTRSIGKFEPQNVERPVAVVTAFQGERRLSENRAANAQLGNDLRRLNFGFYPVIGMGQEMHKALFGLIRWVVPSSEESFVVQARGEISEQAFETVIQGLLQKYGQFFAMVKLPSAPQVFLLRSNGTRDYQGSEVGARTAQDSYYSQLKSGPRAHASMLSPWEIWGERNPAKRVINWWSERSAMNRPADRSKIGRRFSVKPAEREE